jgi:hypothetical protein
LQAMVSCLQFQVITKEVVRIPSAFPLTFLTCVTLS